MAYKIDVTSKTSISRALLDLTKVAVPPLFHDCSARSLAPIPFPVRQVPLISVLADIDALPAPFRVSAPATRVFHAHLFNRRSFPVSQQKLLGLLLGQPADLARPRMHFY